ncbi:unnamed protein product [Chrysoparadoxa australica]
MEGSILVEEREMSVSSLSEPVKDLISASVGATLSVYTGQPMDTMKVRMQLFPKEYTHAIPTAARMCKEEGFHSMWKGSTPALAGALCENCVAFVVNGQLKRLWPEHEGSVPRSFASGGVTGLVTAFALCPADVVKCRLQAVTASGMTATGMCSSILASQGPGGLYRGLSSQVFREVPFFAVFFGVYDNLKTWATEGGKGVPQFIRNTPDDIIYLASGGFAGQAGWIATMPMDMVKSRMQSSTASPAPRFLDVFKSVVKQRGYGGLFTGLNVTLMRAFPANAALFYGFEICKARLP